MNHPTDHYGHDHFEAIIREARMQRSVAVGNAIAGLVAAAQSGLTRAVNAVKTGLGASKSQAQADANSALDVPAHR